MAWISQSGASPKFSAPYLPLATTTSVTNVAVTAVGNDVFGKVTMVVTGTVAQGVVATIVPPVALPAAAVVQVTPQNSQTVVGGIASTIGWFGSVNSSGNIAIGTGMTISSALSTAIVAYFVGL